MEKYLQLFILLPAVGYLLSLLVPHKNEQMMAQLSATTLGLFLISLTIFSGVWILGAHPALNLKEIVIFQSQEYEFFIDFYFDRVTLIFSVVGVVLAFLIVMYSRVYMHRESGYKRFFNTILFFFLGYNVTVFSGNFETLFIGWEILGVSSFLLIAFYRERYLPVKNSLKVFFIYRIGDVGLILAMWMSHHLWHENISFTKLQQTALVNHELMNHSLEGVVVSILVLIAAYAKSAQVPFSSWLPRAMEGPTPSSAIFYGSLSVHVGVFLLIRTFPFFEFQWSIRILMTIMGLITSFIAWNIAKVQSSIKCQIAYSSIAQIGLMFVEIALGLEIFALIHFVGNAFLRTYQLLVSPSIVSYRIREQFFKTTESKITHNSLIPEKWKNTIYLLSMKEWNLDQLVYKLLWSPLKFAGRSLDFIRPKQMFLLFIPLFVIGLLGLFFKVSLPNVLSNWLPIIFALIGLLMVLKAFSEYKNVRFIWWLIAINHLWIALAVSYNDTFIWSETILYLSGVLLAVITGSMILHRIEKKEGVVSIRYFNGFTFKYKAMGFVFLLCGLMVSGFPISPTFIGEDLIFSHIQENQFILAGLISLSIIIDGIAMIRLYARLFLGPYVQHQKFVNHSL